MIGARFKQSEIKFDHYVQEPNRARQQENKSVKKESKAKSKPKRKAVGQCDQQSKRARA